MDTLFRLMKVTGNCRGKKVLEVQDGTAHVLLLCETERTMLEADAQHPSHYGLIIAPLGAAGGKTPSNVTAE